MTYWPCSRLNQAWRSVWVTCSISAYGAPISGGAAALGSIPLGYYAGPVAPFTPYLGLSQLDAPSGTYVPGTGGAGDVNAPNLCGNSPTTGGNFARNRCRRALDTYGNLVKLCQHETLLATFGAATTAGNGPPDFAPAAGHQPHAQNVMQLAIQAQYCLTGGVPLTPSGTCPGLNGWFTVVFNACNFKMAPGVPQSSPLNAISPYTPNYFNTAWGSLPSGASTTVQFTTPAFFCGTATTGPGEWNPSGPTFRGSKCRKALDIFGRTAYKCTPGGSAPGTPGLGQNDWTKYLAPAFTSFTPGCQY